MTQAELAALARVSRRTLISMEKGNSAELSKVFAVLRALDLRMRLEETPHDFSLESLYRDTDPL